MYKKKKIRSIDQLESEAKNTFDLINSIIGNIQAKQALFDFLKIDDPLKSEKRSQKEKEMIRVLKFSDSKMDKIYEMGFINLFAVFEYFQFCLVKELILAYPDSIPADRKFSYNDFSSIKSVKKIHTTISDLIAMEESYTLLNFEKFLQKHNVQLFLDKKHKNRWLILDQLRNIFLHGGSIANAKFSKEMEKLGIGKVEIGTFISLDRERYFKVLNLEILQIIERLRKETTKFEPKISES
jgi:hypothetical protein